MENLKDPGLFWSRNPVPSLALNQSEYDRMGCYWQGGVWAPTNYMVVEGLKKYGYDDLAEEIARRYLEMLTLVYAKTRTLWEVYSPEIDSPATNASGIHLVEPEFVGGPVWGPISMLIETILGIEVDAPAQTIRWRINGPGRQGHSQPDLCRRTGGSGCHADLRRLRSGHEKRQARQNHRFPPNGVTPPSIWNPHGRYAQPSLKHNL